MKLLLDECLPIGLRQCFREHEVHTARWAGFDGIENGQLLVAAEAAGYQVLVTADRGISYQNSAGTRRIALMVLRAKTNQLEDLLPLVGEITRRLDGVLPGEIVTIPESGSVPQ